MNRGKIPEQINETRNWFFEMINKTDKILDKLIKNRKRDRPK